MSLPDFDLPRHNAVLSVEMTNYNVPRLVEELGRFAAGSQFIVGVTVANHALVDGTAFAGGHTVEHREDYGTITVALDTNEGIRSATRLFVSEERAAEIADTYTLPEHLRNPDNHVDAFIGFIIKKLVGHADEASDTFQEQADESTDTLVALPGLTSSQRMVMAMSGETNLSTAQYNALYRPQQVETMEHVLRFLIAREQAKPHTGGNFYAGIDYDFATGILAEALQIINGVNGFNDDYGNPSSNDLLYRGLLPQKSSLATKDGGVYFSGVKGPEPIWPPETVATYQAEQLAKVEAEAARELQLRAQREADAIARAQAAARTTAEIAQTMEDLASGGFVWQGIMQITPDGRMSSPDKVRDFYCEKYGVAPDDVRIIENVAIYGGNNPKVAPGNVTVYIRQNTKPEA